MKKALFRFSHILPAAAMCAVPGFAIAAITIGQGPEIGTDTGGTTYYEEFQDWDSADVRALDNPFDSASLGDGSDNSRDLVAFYTRQENENLYLRVDLFDLGFGAENGSLDIYVLIDCADGGTNNLPNGIGGTTTRQWDLAVATYDPVNYGIIDSGGNSSTDGHLGAYFRADLDGAEFGVSRARLQQAGWDGSSELHYYVFTAKDFGNQVADSFGLDMAIAGIASVGTAKFATIAHGNQSLNRGDSMRDRIFIGADQTGVGAPSGFRLTLDTHTIFDVPLNIHMSATLITAIRWIKDQNPVLDGGLFLDIVGNIIDSNQDEDPGAMIGGVFSEHIMPFFNGPINQSSIAQFDAMTEDIWGLTGDDMKVMHVPERVIHSVEAAGQDPWEDIVASEYTATYLDEVAHIRNWFYPDDPWTGIGGEYGIPRQHKIHKINGVYTFLINDQEDQYKFWPMDDGANHNWRENLLYKALDSDQEQLTLIFDDWEALAGYSFGSGYNNNAIQYNQVIRWVANKQWIEVVTLLDILERAIGPNGNANWVIDQGEVGDKPFDTYDYLHHATEDSYANWYWGSDLEESFRDAVPVLDGTVGSGTAIPSGKVFGDTGTEGTIIYDTWAAVTAAPAGNLRTLAEKAYSAMIYETAWHDEDNTNYERDPNTNYKTWLFPDTTYDRVSGWAFTLHNQLRAVTITTAAAQWAEDIRQGARAGEVVTTEIDLDQDGQNEYVISNNFFWLAFETRGGRCVQGYYFDQAAQDAVSILGSSPVNNPSTQGEVEGTTNASRCSAFKDMNNDAYADVIYTANVSADRLSFTSPDTNITKTVILTANSPVARVEYSNSLGEDLYTRLGVSVNNLDLLYQGQNFVSSYSPSQFSQVNNTLGSLTIDATENSSINQIDDFTRFVIPLTEQMEVRLGGGTAAFTLTVPGEAQPPVGTEYWMIR